MSGRDTGVGSMATTRMPRHRWPARWKIVLAVVAVLLLSVILVVTYYLQPTQLTALVLDRASHALNLDLRTSGPGSYALRPEPRLVLPGLSARVPGTTLPFFHSDQVELALPWSTLRGGDLVITRVVLKSPDLDLPAMQRWLATRPPSTQPFKLPRLTHGLGIENGLLRGDGWRIERLELGLPSLADGDPATLEASGSLLLGAMPSKFELALAGTPAGHEHGIRIADAQLALKADGELPSLKASGNLLAADTFALDLKGNLQSLPAGWAASFDSNYTHGDTPFSIAMTGTPSSLPSVRTTPKPPAPLNFRLQQFSIGDPARQPVLALAGELTTQSAPTGTTIDAALRGDLSRWPGAWPALPVPLAANAAPVVFTATYRGPHDLSALIAYDASRSDTHLHGKFRIADIKAWLSNKLAGFIPPIIAQLQTPAIEISGVQLQGVRMDIHEDAVVPATTPRPAVKSPGVAQSP